MDRKLRLIKTDDVSAEDSSSAGNVTKSYSERPFFDPKLLTEILQRFSIAPDRALPDELVICIRKMARERLFDFINLCKSYQVEFEELFDLLSQRGYSEEALFLAVERFVQDVYIKLMGKLGELDHATINRARKLNLVDEDLEKIADELVSRIESEFRNSSLPGQLDTLAQLRKIVSQ